MYNFTLIELVNLYICFRTSGGAWWLIPPYPPKIFLPQGGLMLEQDQDPNNGPPVSQHCPEQCTYVVLD